LGEGDGKSRTAVHYSWLKTPVLSFCTRSSYIVLLSVAECALFSRISEDCLMHLRLTIFANCISNCCTYCHSQSDACRAGNLKYL